MRINWVAAAPWICTIGLFALWEGAVWLLEIAPYVLPPPSLVAAASWEFGDALWHNSIQTLWTTTAGFGIAVVFGLALGLFVGWDRTVYAGLYPLMVGFNSIPKVAVVPILVIWFGSGWFTRGADRIPDFLFSHRGQRGHGSRHHRAGDGGRAAGARREEAGHHDQGRHPEIADPTSSGR